MYKLQDNKALMDISDVINGVYSNTQQDTSAKEAIFSSERSKVQSSVSLYMMRQSTKNGSSTIDELPIMEIASLDTYNISKCKSDLKSYVPTDTSKTYYIIDLEKIGLQNETNESIKNFIIDSTGKVYYNGNPDNY